MRTVVQKYGGSSLASVEQIRNVAARVASARRGGRAVVVVVSARGDTTDDLLAIAAQVDADPPGRELDQLLATGECASAALLALALHGLGIRAVSLTGPQAGVLATGRHGAGVIAAMHADRVQGLLAQGNVVVIAGFQGLNVDGDIVTLGRGGSDTTAVALAVGLGTRRCEIYTDVDGVYSADPFVVANARPHASLDIRVMAELAFAGARVLHPRSVELAEMRGVDVHVRSCAAGSTGTVIRNDAAVDVLESAGCIAAVTHDLDVARLLVRSTASGPDLATDIFGVLARYGVPADLVARLGEREAGFRMSFTIRRSDLADIRAPMLRALGGQRRSLVVDENVGKVSLVGSGLLSRPGHTARMLSTLSAAGIAPGFIHTSQSRISVAVRLDHALEAVRILHDEFELERPLAHTQMAKGGRHDRRDLSCP